jgi:hypothetical protein
MRMSLHHIRRARGGFALGGLLLAVLAMPGPLRGADSDPANALRDALAQAQPADSDDLLDQFDDAPGGEEGGADAPSDDLLDAFDEPAPAPAPGPGGGDLLDAFDAPAPEAAADADDGRLLPKWIGIDGSLSLQGAYNYQQEPPVPQRGWSKLRPLLRLDVTLDLPGTWEAQASGIAFHDYAYELKGEDEFTNEVIEQYQEEVELRELFVRGSLLPKLDLKEGRQIVVWGFADLIRVVDVLNPIENREPGLTDIEDARLPIWMTRLDYYFGDFALQGVAVHEIEFNKDPVYGSDFYPADAPAPREDKPNENIHNTEYALSLVGYFSGWDLAFYYADYYDDSAHFENVSSDPMIPNFHLRHSRLTMYGAAVNIAAGNWLIKGETALFQGLEFAGLPGETKDRWDILGGFDYTGITDTTLTAEAVNRRILDYDDALDNDFDGAGEDQNQYAFSYRGDFWHQTLELVAVWFFFGDRGDDGGVQRYEAGYDWFDAFTTSFGVLIFLSGGDENPLFQRVRNNDRVYFDVKYSF